MPEKTREPEIRIKEPDGPASDAQEELLRDLYAAGVISEEEVVAFNEQPTKQTASDLIGAHSDEAGFKDVQDARRETRAEARTQRASKAQEDTGRVEYAKTRMPAAFLRPHTLEAKDGRTFEKAYVHFPEGTKVNGIDLSGYSCDVFLNERMTQQMLSGAQVTLSFRTDEQVPVWTGKKDDPEHPYKRFEVRPWDLVKAIKACNEEFRESRAAERAAEKEQGGMSLAGEAKASRDAADALSGHDENETGERNR